MHVECFQKYIQTSLRNRTCPICLEPFQETILDLYSKSSSSLASFLRNGEVKIGLDEIKNLVNSKQFDLRLFFRHFNSLVRADNCDPKKLEMLIPNLPLNFDQPTADFFSETFKFILFANRIGATHISSREKFRWTVCNIKCAVALMKDNRNPVSNLEPICQFLEGTEFVTADLWDRACAFNDSKLLRLLLPHANSSCFIDGFVGSKIALKAGDFELLKGLIERNKAYVLKTLRPLFRRRKFQCPNPETAIILIELGIRVENLFSVKLLLSNDRETVTSLLKTGMRSFDCLLNLRDVLKKPLSSEKLFNLVDFALTLLGLVHFPEEFDWLLSSYVSGKLDPVEYNKKINLSNKPLVNRHAIEILKPLIQETWKLDSSISKISRRLSSDNDYFEKIYQFSICRSVPLLTKWTYAELKRSHPEVIALLKRISIPIVDVLRSKLKKMIKAKDKEGICKYFEKREMDQSEIYRAFVYASSLGHVELFNGLVG